jgi:hypothetical protein
MNNCDKDKIRNPETGRCVLKTGAIGKKILEKLKKEHKKGKKESNKKESNNKEPKKKEEKPCDKDKIRNPETGRCVLKTGAIGKKILEKNSPKKSNNSFKTPPKNFKSKGYLKINNKKINKISGPVKIIILKPKIDFYKKYKLPLFILFSDIHESIRNMCTDCNCENKFEECCYPIYSKLFLKLFDNLYTDDFPIDFSIEAGIRDDIAFGNKLNRRNVKEYPLNILRDNYNTCFNKKIKENDLNYYKLNCPTENIRWQRGDARFHYYKNYKYTLESFSDYLYELIEKNEDEETFEFKLFNIEINYPNYKKYLKILRHLFDSDFFDYIKQYSSVYKQMKKIDIPFIKDNFENWVAVYMKYIINRIKPKLKITKNEYIKFLDKIEKCLEFKNKKDIKDLILFKNKYRHKLRHSLISINTAFLDLYFLLRTFKKPQGSKKTFISIGYFGAYHTENIKYFLTHIMKSYDIVYEYKKNDDVIQSYNKIKKENRCIEFDKKIDLQETIDFYKNLN